ncbi:MAG TPA: hypothetical protein PLI09_21650 [Candidatus Hydrogenedentes bacterium]|nr:hypothetical protein [Candidatus Hydrogenedentota bacterium]
MLIFETYKAAWPMCLGFIAIFLAVGTLVYFLRIPRWERSLNARAVFWVCCVLWVIFMGIVMTLVDSPYLPFSQGTITWLFMLSAFLGIPMAMPLLAGVFWALQCSLRKESIPLSTFLLVAFAAFGLGLAVSNVHDILWCGIITDGFSKHYKAGGDLDFFVYAGLPFGVSRETTADYAALGPFAILLVAGELFWAAVSVLRLKKNNAAK